MAATKTSDGRWRAWGFVDGKQVFREARTRREAERKVQLAIADARTEPTMTKATAELTADEAVQRYLATVSNGQRPPAEPSPIHADGRDQMQAPSVPVVGPEMDGVVPAITQGRPWAWEGQALRLEEADDLAGIVDVLAEAGRLAEQLRSRLVSGHNVDLAPRANQSRRPSETE